MNSKRFSGAIFAIITLFNLPVFAAGWQITGYDSHVELNWESLHEEGTRYRVQVTQDGKNWHTRLETNSAFAMDFVRDLGTNLTLQYRLMEVNGDTETELATGEAKTRDFTDDELLDMVQRYTFRYFWDHAEPSSGMARERIPFMDQDGDIVTTGGTGFGIAAIITAAERGWVNRKAAVARLNKMTDHLEQFERFKGMWAHWYTADDLNAFNFSKYDDGGDIVESAFMMQGLLTARQYFNGEDKEEQRLRNRITALWEDMDWEWYTQGKDILYWHWSKNYGWKMNHPIKGYNEALIVYILAASSPTNAISAEPYHEGWGGWEVKEFRNYSTYYGMTLPLGNKVNMGGPLFFAHYSFMGLDPRGLRDRYTNYWEQNKRHTLINRAYCIDNPFGWQGYGEDLWGLTAGDMVPVGYTAHAPGAERDHGTIAPTAALSSMPYTPAESMKVLKNLYRNHGRHMFGRMGFFDGINLSVSDNPETQVRNTYLAIDQGPIVGMIENYRTALLWNTFMKDKDVQRGLKKLGFTIDHKVQSNIQSIGH
ncbi:glucoamylase family protein [Alteromonas sp. RKMC-009]|uniref:glucoamylase family protein n=1 Tax=Alteromonas sp. RKMC-009 TaxID=2267264 RepID=UPI000E68F662|nr:glucoamylase family protein [Alteromonas sp. RKMC-009]AYA65552.1 beta-glucosidase [Alteromonas sp. RKMC-009]